MSVDKKLEDCEGLRTDKKKGNKKNNVILVEFLSFTLIICVLSISPKTHPPVSHIKSHTPVPVDDHEDDEG